MMWTLSASQVHLIYKQHTSSVYFYYTQMRDILNGILVKLLLCAFLRLQNDKSESYNEIVRNFEKQKSINLVSEIITKSSSEERFDNGKDKFQILMLASSVINYNYAGDPLYLMSFINAIQLLETLAKNDEQEILRLFIISKLTGSAYDIVSNNDNTIEDIKTSLLKNIKYDSYEVVLSRMLVLPYETLSVYQFIEKGKVLANDLVRAYKQDGCPRLFAIKETIHKVTEMCISRTCFQPVKIILQSASFENIQDVFDKFETAENERIKRKDIHLTSTNFHCFDKRFFRRSIKDNEFNIRKSNRNHFNIQNSNQKQFYNSQNRHTVREYLRPSQSVYSNDVRNTYSLPTNINEKTIINNPNNRRQIKSNPDFKIKMNSSYHSDPYNSNNKTNHNLYFNAYNAKIATSNKRSNFNDSISETSAKILSDKTNTFRKRGNTYPRIKFKENNEKQTGMYKNQKQESSGDTNVLQNPSHGKPKVPYDRQFRTHRYSVPKLIIYHKSTGPKTSFDRNCHNSYKNSMNSTVTIEDIGPE